MKINRLTTIIGVCIRYRLDTFIKKGKLPYRLKILLLFTKIFPKAKKNRGERLRRALESLGPIFVKFGQLLSTRPDLIPPDICSELGRLQDDVPPFDNEVFISIVEEALGKKISDLFLSFDRQPLASASVAQVHSAVLPDGEKVVVKVIRPGIGRIIEQDIELMLSIAKWLENNTLDGRRMKLTEIVSDYKITIFDELNLQREAANASMLRRNFQDSTMLYVPSIYWEYTNQKVMVMEQIYAAPVTDIATLRKYGTDFKILAERGVEIFFMQVFEHNLFHADMHPGNIFVDYSKPKEPKYLAIDCAIIGTLSDADQYYLARNLLAIFRRDYKQVAELHILSGWVPEETNVGDFTAAIRSVCEPIFGLPLKEISFGYLLVSLFQTARRFEMEVQPSLVLLQKTLLNIEGLGRQLYPDLDLWETAHPFLERWLKNRFKPKAYIEKLKRYGPEWLEQLPQIPQMIFQNLEKIQKNNKQSGELVPVKSKPKKFISYHWIGFTFIGGGLSLGFSDWVEITNNIPQNSLLLVGIGLLILLFK